jgi:uncharacterized membrane protein YhaH (DUF805 family)
LTQIFFSPGGLINRQAFTLAWLFWVCVEGAAVTGVFSAEKGTGQEAMWGLAMLVASALSTVSLVILVIKRARSIGWSPLVAVLTLVPVVSLFLLLYLSGKHTPDDPDRIF